MGKSDHSWPPSTTNASRRPFGPECSSRTAIGSSKSWAPAVWAGFSWRGTCGWIDRWPSRSACCSGRFGELNRDRIEELRRCFAEEARLGANLTHPAIATVFDYGFHEHNPFTVFEYLHGQTLGQSLRSRGRLTLEEVRLIIGPLAQGLDFAHSRHVVHRDLKPENIRATEQGLFKILDLGLAKEFRRDADWSGFAGTPAYAAPEQAAGKACDGRTDQYALALIAFELLAGRRLFESSRSSGPARAPPRRPPDRDREALQDVPGPILQALRRALSKDPNERFATCSDFAVSLGCQLLNIPVPSDVVVYETDVEQMTIGRFRRRLSLGWLSNSVHLVLTRSRIWAVYHTEIHDWPLDRITRVEPEVGPRAAPSPEEADVRDAPLGPSRHRGPGPKLGWALRSLGLLLVIAMILFLLTFGADLAGWSRGSLLCLPAAMVISNMLNE